MDKKFIAVIAVIVIRTGFSASGIAAPLGVIDGHGSCSEVLASHEPRRTRQKTVKQKVKVLRV